RAGQGEAVSVWAEVHSKKYINLNLRFMRKDTRARRRIPDLNGLIPTGGSQPGSVGTERHMIGPVRVTGEGKGFLTRDRVPYPHAPVKARGGDLGTVRAKGNAVNHT